MTHLPLSRPARRAWTLALLAALSGGLPALATAADAYPSKPIRLVVPFPPGGSTDLLARQIGEKLATAMGQPVVVDNKPGAGGTVGSDLVAKSPADGYTLLMGVTGSNAISATLYPKLPYDPVKDFAPVSIVVSAPLVLAVNASSPHKTVADVIAYAGKNPDRFSHGSPGAGTSMHLTGEMFAVATQTRLSHIPYKGSAPALQDLLGGQIDAMFGDLLVLQPLVKDGKLRALAVTSARRSPMLPEVPTLAESGLAGFEALSWQGIFAPAGTPPEVLQKLSAEIVKAVRGEDLKGFFAQRGFLIEARTPEDSKRFIEAEVPKWGRIVKLSGASAN
jgi:tripartite-type tricarboxylate transporter receptor subunit TctC